MSKQPQRHIAVIDFADMSGNPVAARGKDVSAATLGVDKDGFDALIKADMVRAVGGKDKGKDKGKEAAEK